MEINLNVFFCILWFKLQIIWLKLMIKSMGVCTCYNVTGGGSQSRIVAGGNSSSTSSSRVLRLFGVNMECQPDNNNNNNNIDSETYNNNMLSTQGTATPQFYNHDLHRQSSNPHTHMVVPQQPY